MCIIGAVYTTIFLKNKIDTIVSTANKTNVDTVVSIFTIYIIRAVQHNNIFGRNNKIDTNVLTLLFLFVTHATCFDPYCWVIIRRVKNISLS
jgi:hypothetical protein